MQLAMNEDGINQFEKFCNPKNDMTNKTIQEEFKFGAPDRSDSQFFDFGSRKKRSTTDPELFTNEKEAAALFKDNDKIELTTKTNIPRLNLANIK